MDNEREVKIDRKMKAYLVYDYLMRHSDENNIVKTKELIEYLGSFDIMAERRSIYSDIDEINQLILLTEGIANDIKEAKEICQDEEERTIIYDPHRKGFYVRQRHYNAGDIRMMAECVYAARFLDEKTAKKLIDVVCGHVSIYEAEKIKHRAFLTDRVKTDCTTVHTNVSLINDAMSLVLDGEKHTPEKIKFKYLKRSIQNIRNRVESRHGAEYVVSPFELLINDGNYYMLAFDDKTKKLLTFRVDRMKNIKFTNIPRDGEEKFKQINMATYAKEHFGMFGGAREHVTLRFIEPLLDTIVDRFGVEDVVYSRDEGKYLKAVVSVAVSEQFYGWVAGLGRRVKIVAPGHVVDGYKAHLDKVRRDYD